MKKILIALVAVVALALGLYFLWNTGVEPKDSVPQVAVTDAEIAGVIDWDGLARDTIAHFTKLGTCRKCGELSAAITGDKSGPYWSGFCWSCGASGSYLGSSKPDNYDLFIDRDGPVINSLGAIRDHLESRYLHARNPIAVAAVQRSR